jgi:preprotein translocase subunit YajC
MGKYIYGILAALALLPATQVFADDAAGQAGGAPGTFIILAMALVFFYFILWRPEQKRRKQTEAQRNAMKVGDQITAMGILGTLVQIKEKTVVLKMVDGSKIEMLKACVTDVQSAAETKVEEISKS